MKRLAPTTSRVGDIIDMMWDDGLYTQSEEVWRLARERDTLKDALKQLIQLATEAQALL